MHHPAPREEHGGIHGVEATIIEMALLLITSLMQLLVSLRQPMLHQTLGQDLGRGEGLTNHTTPTG